MSGLPVLKMKISAPSAHFKIAHSRDPRRTYPLPPYSTVIGLLANVTGEQGDIDRMLSVPFALGIVSRYRCVTREYTWLRNLEPGAHRSRFLFNDNRQWQERPEHPGGQSPVTFEVLNDVEVYLYLYHPDRQVFDCLLHNLDAPERWLSHLHLGRAEDWAAVEEKGVMELLVSNSGRDFRQAASYYQWLPGPAFAAGVGMVIDEQEYSEFYCKMQGNAVLVTSVYKLVDVVQGGNKKVVIRNFHHVPARLCKSQVPFLSNFTLPSLFVDRELGTPVYMCRIDPGKRSC